MEIIKPGNIERKDGVIQFTCSKCGCVFKAKREEYKHESCQWDNSNWYETNCPFCGCRVMIDSIEVKRQNNWE